MSHQHRVRKWFVTLMSMIMVVSLVVSCAPAPATQAPQPAATQAPAVEETVAPAEPAAPAEDGRFTIGISNPFISSEYRTQMIQELKDINAEYMAAGITNELVIESADTDVAGQIQQLQNLMSKNVDAILVNPGDAQGLNATLEEAVKQGILVLSIDQELDAEGVYNVGHNQKEWAMTSAKWLAEKLQAGNIVEIEGFPGHPANEYRMSGVDEVLANYPDIKVLARETGKWDEATGQQVMSNFLAGFPGQIDGVWTQDGMAIGALQAVMAANPEKWPIMVGEGRCQYLKLWDQVRQTRPDFESIGVANAPGVNATALRIAVLMLQGKQVDTSKLSGQTGTTFIIPSPVTVTKENFEEWLAFCQDKPDQYLLDGIMTEEEVLKSFFVQEGAAVQEKFTIGISNPFISSEYRTQMIQELKDVNAEYMAAGITNELVIESADTDVAGQIQQLQNLMSKGVDAILVNPGDAQGLNATLEEAVKAGILVLSIDQELDAEGVYNVGHNQKEWAMTSARWLAEKLQAGNIVEIEGFPGHPANEYRMSGVDEVLAEFPDIKVLARETGKWDEATGQQVMSNFLAGFPGQIDGVWTQDGMAIGALQAVMAANPPEWPIMVGEGRCQYLKLWDQVRQTRPDFESIGVANAPGVNATGLRIAVAMLQGKKVDTSKLSGQTGTSFIIPIPVIVTGENFQEWLDFCQDKPDQFLLDGIMTEEEVLQNFFLP